MKLAIYLSAIPKNKNDIKLAVLQRFGAGVQAAGDEVEFVTTNNIVNNNIVCNNNNIVNNDDDLIVIPLKKQKTIINTTNNYLQPTNNNNVQVDLQTLLRRK